MKKLRMLSLCSGIGGADLAAEWTNGIEVVGQVEIDPFCNKVLAKHWPDVKRMSDIKEVHGDEFGHIDIIVAGIPCQPHSLAGQRKASCDERDLWPEVHRIIGAIRPRWCVVENPPGLLTSESGQFFGSMLFDLDQMGYRVGWAVYGVCAVGAPHQRERIFLVAYSSGSGREECDSPTIADQPGHVAWRTRAPGEPGQFEPGICGSTDGIANWVDGHRWPAGPGERQYDFEPPRVIDGKQPNRTKRLKALGNAICPQQIYPVFEAIVKQER